MCGRFVVTNPVAKTKGIVKTAIKVEDIENYNAHPAQNLPVVKKYTNGNTLELLKWGIIPSWSKKKDFKPLINARLETIDEKISFKKHIKIHRCVAVADGFYEWKRDGKEKIPFYFIRDDKKMLFIAGIFADNQFCLITEQASQNVNEIFSSIVSSLAFISGLKSFCFDQDGVIPHLSNSSVFPFVYFLTTGKF